MARSQMTFRTGGLRLQLNDVEYGLRVSDGDVSSWTTPSLFINETTFHVPGGGPARGQGGARMRQAVQSPAHIRSSATRRVA